MAETLFEGDDIYVQFTPTEGASILLVTFSHATNSNVQGRPFAAELLKSCNVSLLAIVARRNHWWQCGEIEKIGDIVSKHAAIAGHDQRVGYGSSMGAFGALIHSRRFSIDRLILICPQSTLANANVPLRSNWAGWIAERPVIYDDVGESSADPCEIIVIFDPHDALDTGHVRHLETKRPVTRLIMPFTGHPPTTFLMDIGALKASIIDLIMGADATEIRRRVRPLRRKSLYYWRGAARALSRRHRRWALTAVDEAMICLAASDLPSEQVARIKPGLLTMHEGLVNAIAGRPLKAPPSPNADPAPVNIARLASENA